MSEYPLKRKLNIFYNSFPTNFKQRNFFYHFVQSVLSTGSVTLELISKLVPPLTGQLVTSILDIVLIIISAVMHNLNYF